ncbi:histidinol-phosphate transaminase [Lentimicrobium sp. S6]|uniref:pyridoxal phosphate-dependent aminotransferase n=1 Tax=Lentimicrobium sp. S6 TaxID=2735872 RepID=UPI001551ABFC|nr:histidinol-phosphate transaminase [Lentimicrobium sp. S6]NPD47187.1 histidinol-phosphate aminotransferase family protein [Lentimicrobium sp. S6]
MEIKYNTPEEKYEYIAKQHGGYYRHHFTDHAYLYNLYFPPKQVFDHLKDNIHNLVLNYPMAQNALAELIGELIHQDANKIIVGNGAAEIIKILSGSLAKKLIVPVPSFNEYANAAPEGRVVEFPLEFPSFQLDVDKFAAEAIKVGADVAVVVTPNNPTSLVVPKPDLIRLAEKLKPSNCMLIIDESFLDFTDKKEQISLELDIDKYPNMAILKSMSKAYGICGLRIGYMLTANLEFAQAVRNGIHIWNINGFAEEFLRILPQYKQEFEASCEEVKVDRDVFYKELCAIEGMTVFKPDANYIYCRLPDDALSGPEVCKRLFIKHNIYIKDSAGKTQPDGDRYIRIASRSQKENSTLIIGLKEVMYG